MTRAGMYQNSQGSPTTTGNGQNALGISTSNPLSLGDPSAHAKLRSRLVQSLVTYMMRRQSDESFGWVESYEEDSTKTGFLDLPREIRDLIYGFAFHVSGAIFIYSANPYSVRPDPRAMVVRHRNEGPLEPQKVGHTLPISMLRTCKQLHAEGTPVLYGENVFRVWFMSDTELSLEYRKLVRHVIFTTEADHRIHKPDFDEANYGWKRRFWPSTITAGLSLLERFPSLETLTCIPITPARSEWRPVFFAVDYKTRSQRVALAAQWLQSRCPIEDERLRACLQMELIPPHGLSKDDFKGSTFHPEEDDTMWDRSEFADAFQLMKRLG